MCVWGGGGRGERGGLRAIFSLDIRSCLCRELSLPRLNTTSRTNRRSGLDFDDDAYS